MPTLTPIASWLRTKVSIIGVAMSVDDPPSPSITPCSSLNSHSRLTGPYLILPKMSRLRMSSSPLRIDSRLTFGSCWATIVIIIIAVLYELAAKGSGRRL
jgi:hypothetical protein